MEKPKKMCRGRIQREVRVCMPERDTSRIQGLAVCTGEELNHMKIFQERLQGLRESQHKSRRVVSELSGLAPNAVRKYERGEAAPNAESLGQLADYFGVTMDYLWGRND